MRVYVALSLLIVVLAEPLPVKIIDSDGRDVSPDRPYYFRDGDYIDCVLDGAAVKPVFYAWRRIINIRDQLADGPTLLTFPNVDFASRLYMSRILGFGQQTGYKCVGAFGDPADPESIEWTGANVYFEVATAPSAGFAFYGRDYVQVTDDTIDLTCQRQFDTGRVVWETIDLESGNTIVLYDTDDEDVELPRRGYEFVDPPLNETHTDYTLRITMLNDDSTAVAHRCTVSDTENEMKLTTVTSTALLFRADFASENGCESNPEDVNDLLIGTPITFSGCDVTVHTGDDFITNDDYTVMTLWTKITKDVEEEVIHVDMEDSRVLDGASTYTTEVTPDMDNSVIGCAVQVHREEASTVRARIDDICATPINITINATEVRFRIYIGDRENMNDDEFITFGTFNRYKVFVEERGDITCEVDAIPAPEANTVKMQTQSPGDEEWVTDEDHVIESSELQSGAIYRCVYEHEGVEKVSGGIHVVKGVINTKIRDSSGTDLNQDDIYELNAGDFIECLPDEPVSPYYPPQYMWRLSEIDIQNSFGPRIVRQQNGQNYVNRLYIDQELGRGEPIAYRCVGTDYLDGFFVGTVGTVVKFRVVNIPAGTVFDEGDYAVEVDETVDLPCVRASESVRVIWDAVALNGSLVETLYDSEDNEVELPEGYQFVDNNPGESNDYTLRITVTEATAIFTRCTMLPLGESRQYTEISRTAMIFAVDQVEECFITDEETIDVGEEVRFRGCDASIVVSDQSGVVDADYQAIMHWAVSPVGSDEFTIIEESRVFDAESIHEETALTEVDGNSYQCGIQISRPNAITNSATIANLCDVDVTLEITENSVNFRIYYGEVSDENLIRLGQYTTYVGNEGDKNMTCQIDRHPTPLSDSEVVMQTRERADDEWENLDSAVVPADQLIDNHYYRCQYFDGSNDRVSSPMRMVDGINDIHEVEIVDSSGELLDVDTVHEVIAGDYVTCRPTNGSVVRPQYMWTKLLSMYSSPGPQVIQNPSDEFGHNRFYFGMALGEGQDTGYACIAADRIADLPIGVPIDRMGKKLKFHVSPGGFSEPAGIPPPDEDHAVLAEAQVSLHCSKSTNESHLIWETVPATGDPVLIYDSTEDVETPPGYAIQQEGQDFILVVTVSNVTALITRCTVSEEGKATVTGSAMIFLIEPHDCTVSGHENANALGDIVHFSGCGGQTITADNSGVTQDHFDAVAYWQQTASGTEEFSIVEESKALSEGTTQSQYHLMVDGEDHDTTLRCGIQVKRPDTAASAGSVDHLCEADYVITVADGDLYFQLHYGESPVIFQDDSNQDELITLGFVDGNEIMCEADAFPENDESEVTVHEMLNGEAWVPHEDSAIEGSVNATYRCAYTSTVGETTTVSASVKLVTAINTVPELGIYRSNSDQLIAEDTIITVDAGDYLVCRPLDNQVVEPGLYYIWEKQGDVSGPRMLHYENEMDGSNRLLVNSDLGAGSATEYICQAAVGDQLEPPAEDVGRRVQFRVEFSTGSANSPHVTVAALLITLLAVFYNY